MILIKWFSNPYFFENMSLPQDVHSALTRHFATTPKHLLLYGPAGLGKTTLMNALAKFPGVQVYTPGQSMKLDTKCAITLLDLDPPTPYSQADFKILSGLTTKFVVFGCSPKWGGASSTLFKQLKLTEADVAYYSLIKPSDEAMDAIGKWLTYRLQCCDSVNHSLSRELEKQNKKGTNLADFVRKIMSQMRKDWDNVKEFDPIVSAAFLARVKTVPPEIPEANRVYHTVWSGNTWQSVGMMPSALGTNKYTLANPVTITTYGNLFLQTKGGDRVPLGEDGNPRPGFDFNTALYLGVRITSSSVEAIRKAIAPFEIATDGLIMSGYEEVIRAIISAKPQKGNNPQTFSGGHITFYYGSLTQEVLKVVLSLIPAEITLDTYLCNGGFSGLFSSVLTQFKNATPLHLSLSTGLNAYPITPAKVQDQPADASSASAAAAATD